MKNIGIGVVTCGIRKLNGNILKYNPVIFEDKERKVIFNSLGREKL